MTSEIKVHQGDARELIKQIETGSVTTVYFDPPFNTGRTFRLSMENDLGFEDVFKDDKEYVSLIEPVLAESHRILKKDGSLFFHISAEQMLIPHMLCSKYFPTVQPICWKRSRSKNNIKNKLVATVDMIFLCSKAKKPKFNLVHQPLDSYYAKNSYKNKDSRGNYALGHIVYTKTQATKRKDRHYSINIEGREFKAKHGWRLSKEDLEEALAEGRIHIPTKSGGNLYKKIYMHESKGKPCTNLWDDLHSIAMGSEGRKYPTQKPLSLLTRIVEMSSDEGDLILDPMAGAGTTGLAAKQLNRNAILFELNEDAVEIIQENLKKIE